MEHARRGGNAHQSRERRFDGPRRSFGGPKEMHKATCSSCGKECEVPFKPTEGRPVYCKDCFKPRTQY